MRKRLTALLCAGLCLLSACHAKPEPAGTEYQVWFAAADPMAGAAVASESRWIPEGTDPVEGLLAALMSGPLSEDLVSPFPQGTRVRNSLLSGVRTLTVDLEERYEGLSGVDLTVADYCIALTLCQLEKIDGVIVTVEGRAIPYRDHQLLRTGDVLLSGAEGEAVTLSVDLYYPGPDGLLVPRRRELLITANGTRASAVLTALMEGQSEAGDVLPLPPGTQLRSAVIDGGLCYPNFSAELLAAEEDQARLLLGAVVNTMCALEGVEGVCLLVEGEPVTAYGGMDTSVPLTWDETLLARNQAEDPPAADP